MKALIAVDGSSDSFSAVEQTARILTAAKDRIALYYVPLGGAQPSNAPDEDAVGRARSSLADEVFARAAEHVPTEMRGGIETIVGSGDVRRGVLAAADQAKADMVSIGARGLGTIKRLLLGSVSHYVAHNAHVPVLVARRVAIKPGQKSLQVLVPCDGSESDELLVRLLNQLSWTGECIGRAMTVVEPMLAGHLPPWVEAHQRSAEVQAMAKAWEAEHRAEVEQRRARLTALSRRMPAPFCTHDPIVAEGHPAEEILSVIARERVQLVVMAARGGGLLSRLLLGSTSDAVLSYAQCSVLVVRSRQ